MSLKVYRKKRDVKKTPEPMTSQKSRGELAFCVQKHDASHLHYDFRLEYKGVLLSWAVPKGLPLRGKEKRLAIQVEDHPLDYQYFEGVIPEGNYGAGTVELWDHGTYRTIEGHSRKEMEKYLKNGLAKGHFGIILFGKRFQGEFVFHRMHDQQWLLFKKEAKTVTTAKMPKFIPPMLATLIQEPFSDPEWLFEVKWDGFRALAFNDVLKSRNDLVFDQFPELNEDLRKIQENVVLDGEIVILDETGKSNFQWMQNYQRTRKGTLAYYVFDLLYVDGKDLRDLPLIERKKILQSLLDKYKFSFVFFSEHILEEGIEFFKKAELAKLEGVIGKRINSCYQSKRSRDWVKVKTSMRQEAVIGGFTEPQGAREKFGALLVGVYNKKQELMYAGQVGGGFSRDILRDVYQKLQPFIQDQCPFKNPPKKKATWVKPKLLCEISFLEWTKENRMRHPVFLGLRDDKCARSVKKEEPEENVTLTNLDKIYFPKEKVTKGDLLTYYQTVAPFILPYLKGRPIILHRYPSGIEGEGFYQKHHEKVPPGIKTFPVKHEGGKVDQYLLIDSAESLLYAIQLGSIDLHPFMARCENLDHPDYCVIDLDPNDVPFEKVIELAQLLHQILDVAKIKHFCKTSGGKGLHILIPLHGKYSFEQSRQFAEIIGHILHERMPENTSLERAPKKRSKKIYIDCLQNRYGQTVVAPFSVRPRPGAKVSTPLEWSEVKKGMTPSQFTIKTVIKRLKKKDPLLPVLKTSVNLLTALNRLKKFL